MSDCSNNAGYDVLRMWADFEDQEFPWFYPLALNGRKLASLELAGPVKNVDVSVNGVPYYPVTGSEGDRLFILPKPDRALVEVSGPMFEAGGCSVRADYGASVLQHAVDAWVREIDGKVVEAVVMAFAKRSGNGIEINGKRYVPARARDWDGGDE